MSHENLSPFVRSLVERTQPASAFDVLAELAQRLQLVHAFPPILPQVGVLLQSILDDVAQAKAVKEADKAKAKAGVMDKPE